jgi:hypothetical protein
MAKAILHNKPQKHCVVCLFVIDPFLERPLAEGTGDTKTEQKTQKPKNTSTAKNRKFDHRTPKHKTQDFVMGG